MRLHSTRLALTLVLSAALTCEYGLQAQAESVEIATGSTEGVYYRAGRVICRAIARADPATTCRALPSAGSVENLDGLAAGTYTTAIVQADQQHDAALGIGRFSARGPDRDLRTLFSLHVEPFTLVARNEAGITSLADLPGRRVNIGNPGSGHRETMALLMQASGWTRSTFSLTSNLDPSEHGLALCQRRVDAIVYTAGHPNASVEKATRLCGARVVDVSGPVVEAILAQHPYFVQAEVPAHLYLSNPKPVRTFGLLATVVTSASLDDETAYRIVSSVFARLDEIRRSHPALATLDPARMAQDGLFAPLHPGAARYFREHNLLSYP